MFQGYIAQLLSVISFIKTKKLVNFWVFIGSGDSIGTRRLGNNGTVMLWSHICQILFDQENVQLKSLPKLQRDHIFLKPYSRLIRLAVQVLSKSGENSLRILWNDWITFLIYSVFEIVSKESKPRTLFWNHLLVILIKDMNG